jgi:nucleoid DNA-binding protein
MAELIEILFDRGSAQTGSEGNDRGFFEVICDTPENSENVWLSGFGNFQLQDKSQRPGRNPKTGETATISTWRIVMLHASQKLKVRLEIGRERVGLMESNSCPFRALLSGNLLPQVTAVQSKSASPPLSGSAPAVPFSSASPHKPPTPSLDTEEKTLIALSASTIVTFIAVAVASFLSRRKDKAKAIKEKRDASR